MKLRIQELIEELGLPVASTYQLYRQCGLSNWPAADRLLHSEVESVSLHNLELLVEGLGLDWNKTPLAAIFQPARETGYRASRAILQNGHPAKIERDGPHDRVTFRIAEIAEMTGRSKEYVRLAAVNGHLRPVEGSSPMVFTAESVIAWCASGMIRGDSPQDRERKRITGAPGSRKGRKDKKPKRTYAPRKKRDRVES